MVKDIIELSLVRLQSMVEDIIESNQAAINGWDIVESN